MYLNFFFFQTFLGKKILRIIKLFIKLFLNFSSVEKSDLHAVVGLTRFHPMSCECDTVLHDPIFTHTIKVPQGCVVCDCLL